MYRFACFVSGVAIAVMVAINGNLTGYYGVYTATEVRGKTGCYSPKKVSCTWRVRARVVSKSTK